MTSNPELIDPWDWDVDRVVQELCTPNRIWQPSSPAMPLISDPISLEAVLREHEVTGSVILGEVNMKVLKEDFGIKALGRRSFIMSAVDQLRSKSLKYQSRNEEQSSNPLASEFSRSLQEAIGRFQWANVKYSPPKPVTRNEYFFTERNAIEEFPELEAPKNIPLLLADSQDSGGITIRSTEDRSEPKPKTPLFTSSADFLSLGSNRDIQENTLLQDTAPASNIPVPDMSLNEISTASKPEEIIGKKRKRLAPTLISQPFEPKNAHNNQTFEISSKDIDNENNKPTDEAQSSTPSFAPDPGALYYGSDGLKRMAPLLLSSPKSGRLPLKNFLPTNKDAFARINALENNKLPHKKSQKLAYSNEFMGKKKMTIDSIFYGGVQDGSELPNTDGQFEFYAGYQNLAKGRRLYVHNALKYFFRSQTEDITENGKICSIKFPYPSKLVPRSRVQSCTVFLRNSHGKIIARRESKICEPAQVSRPIGGERSAVFNPLSRNILESIGTNVEWDHTSLEKYKYLEGGDEILPVYGESDEDNEFDEATWKEIEAELGTRTRPEQRLRKPPISETEIMQAINDGITDLINKWKQKHAAKRACKAWRLWVQSRRLKNKKEQILAAEKDLVHVQEYLEKMKNRILKDIWTSQSQVRKQMGSIEITVFNREDLKWKISILRLKTPPTKPQQNVLISKAKKSSPKAMVDEDGESISASETESSDYDDLDDLDDFIVDDHMLASENEQLRELDLTGSEKDEVSHSDSTISDNLVLSQATKSQIKRKFQSTSTNNLPVNTITDKKFKLAPKPDNKVHKAINVNKSSSFEKKYSSTPAKQRNICSPKPTHSKNQFVDLTLSSSEEDNTPQKPKKSVTVNIIAQKPIKELKDQTKITSPPNNFQSKSSCVPKVPNSESEHVHKLKSLPSLKNPDAIVDHSYSILRKLADGERLLIKYFQNLDLGSRFEFAKYFVDLPEQKLWAELVMAIGRSIAKVLDHEDEKNKRLVQILNLFEIFIKCKYHSVESNLDEKQLRELLQAGPQHFHSFYQICRSLTQKTNAEVQTSRSAEHESSKEIILDSDTDTSDTDESPRTAVKRQRSKFLGNGEVETGYERRPHGKRKKLVHENKEARNMREQNLRRLAEQAERRKKLHASLTKANDSKSIVRSQLIINDAAAEGQKLIYVNDHIARRIKKHQVEGVRFMWNQIVTITDEQSMQGCLLAHTMGLGKTMQTITLLVAIAESSRSSDPLVSSQIPQSLRESRSLILCPPSLVNNWMDELLVWVPDNILGELRKVDSSLKSILQKVQTIIDWREEGGVLVIGYDAFRDLINFKNKKMTSAEHEKVLKDLLEGPNIIIADEAHRMKNTKAAITIAASRFRSKSRIALTGSPLANNVEEYHTMIEWVAPNYLGPIAEFRAKYVEPIQAGNYQNSTAYERRKSLKMLGVLSADLAPKVHRADMSVMKNELPPKKEFVITVPLTDIQKKAYSIFVKSMIEGNNYTTTKSGDVTSTTVWHWLAVLSLLCNHPECFRRKLLKRKEEARTEESNTLNVTDDEEVAIDLNAPVWKVGVSQELVDAENKIFETNKSLESVQMSNKVLLLCQILDACKSVGDKALVFSQSIPTLDFLEDVFKRKNRNYARLDGSTAISKRQGQTKDFNNGNTDIYLISTAAGGLGLNLQGANRVVIFDFKFNPIMEEQAVGRAYRIGQKKPTFVYRFIAGGTFEDSVHNKTVFKTQLASRVIDKKNPIAWANKKTSEFLFEPKDVPEKDLSEFEGMDPSVLDRLLQSQKKKDHQGNPRTICSIVQTDTFAVDDDDKLTPDEEREVQSELEKTRLFRANPQAYQLQQNSEQQLLRQQILSQIQGSYTQGGYNPASYPGILNNDQLKVPPSQPSSYSAVPPSTTNQNKEITLATFPPVVESSATNLDNLSSSQPYTTPTAVHIAHGQSENLHQPSTISDIAAPIDGQVKLQQSHPLLTQSMALSTADQRDEIHQSSVSLAAGTSTVTPAKVLPLKTPTSQSTVSSIIGKSKEPHQYSSHQPSKNPLLDKSDGVKHDSPKTYQGTASTASPLNYLHRISSLRKPDLGEDSTKKTTPINANDLVTPKDSSPVTKMPSLKPRSPVAGANTKVASSNLEPLKSSSTLNPQPKISMPGPKASDADNTTPSESNRPSKTDPHSSGKSSPKNILHKLPSKPAFLDMTIDDSNPKRVSKSGKDWDITKRYRESRASNIPDYGPLSALPIPKQTVDQENLKNLPIKASAKNPRIIPFSPSQKPESSKSYASAPRVKDNIDVSNQSRDINRNGSPPRMGPNISKQTKENSTPIRTRASSPIYRRHPLPLPPPPPLSYGRLPPSYRRPLSPPPYYAPTGPRLSTRKPPPCDDYDMNRAQSYRGQSYRPPPSPYNYPPSSRR